MRKISESNVMFLEYVVAVTCPFWSLNFSQVRSGGVVVGMRGRLKLRGGTPENCVQQLLIILSSFTMFSLPHLFWHLAAV